MTTQNTINNLLATTALTGVLQATQFPALTGDVTTNSGNLATTIASNAVTDAKFRQGVARSVVGVTGNAGANTADIQGTTDQVLRVNGAGTALAFGAIDLSKVAAATGVLQAASFPALTGDVTTASGALATTLATVNSNVGSFTNASITVNGKGLITAASNGTGTFAPMPTTVVTGTTQAVAVNNCYVSNNAGVVTMTLPATAAVGDEIQIMGLGAGGWSLAQNASQLVHFGNVASTTGTGGSIASQNAFDTLKIKCVVANTTFCVIAAQGNMTVT